jgi:hypothetical protein
VEAILFLFELIISCCCIWVIRAIRSLSSVMVTSAVRFILHLFK